MKQLLLRIFPPKILFRVYPILAVCTASTASWASDEEQLAELMAMLNVESELATKYRMNADYVPGMATVLHGEDLRQLGATTIAEVIGHIPGVYVTTGNDGRFRVVVRGVGSQLFGSNIKLFVDGTPMNDAINGGADGFLRIPIEQVDQLEFVRGPGSALYGEYALSGMLNISLKKIGRSMHTAAGSDDFWQFGAVVGRDESNASAWSINGFINDKGSDNTRTGLDIYGVPPTSLGNSPVSEDNSYRNKFLKTEWKKNGNNISILLSESELGNYWGLNGAGDHFEDPAVSQRFSIDLGRQWINQESMEFRTDASYVYSYRDSSHELIVPAGVIPPGDIVAVTGDLYRQDITEGSELNLEAQLKFAFSDTNRLLIGAAYRENHVDNVEGEEVEIGGAITELVGNDNFVLPDTKRKIASGYFQHQWTPLEGLQSTLGTRFDRYSDWGNHLSPRAGLVWTLSDAHILKVQYAEAFKPPTLAESYPGGSFVLSDIDAENLKSLEGSYIYRKGGLVLRTTLFKTAIDGLIEYSQPPGQPPTYNNVGDYDSSGVELEWEQVFGRQLRTSANISHVQTEDKRWDKELVGSVAWLGNVSVLYTPSSKWSLGLHTSYVGEQEGWGERVAGSHQDVYKSHVVSDATISWLNAANIEGLRFYAGVKNLTDEKYHYVPNPASWPEGLQGQGRSWVLAVEYKGN